MTDNFNPENLADEYDEQVSAKLLIISEGSQKALRLLVPTLSKMFIDGVLIGKALSGTLYYDSSKDLEGDDTHYFVQEIPKDDKHRHPTTHVPSGIPTGPPDRLGKPYATSLETAQHALYSPDSIVFYTKEDVESDQIAFQLLILHCPQDMAGSLALSGRIKQYECTGKNHPMTQLSDSSRFCNPNLKFVNESRPYAYVLESARQCL
ncbi:hypothetical protein Clacol_006944 [Clathrus columnatus]|uniref:Uncharacterized protein n=1 Tax=Clathrus columnatus TaxID=1419009 RepID=A0AAV5ALB5_9AGAM|nr:hypothetical protein Clacol_006944 [Clathrus columnatus]